LAAKPLCARLYVALTTFLMDSQEARRHLRRQVRSNFLLVTTRRRCASLLVALVISLAIATGAGAEVVTARDDAGRAITFDVQASSVDVDWYAGLLRAAAHGNEVSTVTIRIVPGERVSALCGEAASACYTRTRAGGLIVVPAGKDLRVAATFLHEYGHHLDRSWSVAGVPELNGTPVWWQARGMAQLLSEGRVAFDYSRGWSRSIGEIFAEDYAWIHVPFQYSIPWLSPPDATLKSALLAELGGQPTSTIPETPAAGPLVITRSGTLAARATRTIPFGLLGPGRRVTFTATVNRATRAGVRARAEVVCNGTRVAVQTFGRGRATRTIDAPNLGPAECQARLVSTAGVRLTYSLRLRLAVQT
jgi:hypothetical protein